MRRRAILGALCWTLGCNQGPIVQDPADSGGLDLQEPDLNLDVRPPSSEVTPVEVSMTDVVFGEFAPPADSGPPTDRGVIIDPSCGRMALGRVDILFVVDNSNSMRENQATLAAQFRVLIDQLVNPPTDPVTGVPRYPRVNSLHVGVVSSDLGTPGSLVVSCANSDQGDNGLLNPIRRGMAMASHQPWTTAPMLRPARCMNDPNQYPTFLTFEAARGDTAAFREDFVCNAFLSTNGCGLEQQLESAYRALVVNDARERAGSTSPNAGFVRDDAVLAIVVITDEEDGSVRDCRYAERDPVSGRPMPCNDATGVFDSTSARWGDTDLNLRLYLYRQGESTDPTWPLDRYLDPANRSRGYLAMKPGHPERVVFAAIAGVPLTLPTRPGGGTDWDALLGRNPNGSDALDTLSVEGPISMRQANRDTQCPLRMVPACRREGTRYDGSRPQCLTTEQYYAWPSRRVAALARRFDETLGNAALSSICRNSYENALTEIVARIQARLCPPP
ncbi:MAG: hypothetical protein HY909_25125 [Deltaproteobacteria bacterium]|nr:hypothetical protein [Deltaproteobacteria bacterium]